MKKHPWIAYVIGAVVLLALAFWAHGHVRFDWATFFDQLKHADWGFLAVGVLMIWVGYLLRAARWALLIKPQKKVSAFSLLGAHVIGFTGVALFGRLAEVVRLFLITKRTRLTFSSQIAVYTVERMFDLGSMALIFSSALLLAPDRASLPHHEALERSAIVGLGIALFLGAFAAIVRTSGRVVARVLEQAIGRFSLKVGHSVANRVLAFREGLNGVGTIPDFLYALLLSLAMWGLITSSYLLTTRAFVLSPVLSSMTLGRCMVLMAASMVGSVVQLPVIGWFTQVGVIAGAAQKIFGVAPEAALGCASMLLIVTFLSVIPLGLVWARFEHVSLKQVSEESEELAAETDEQTVAASEM